MIKVKYQISDNIVKNIEIKGHAKHGDFGQDIVCASVSTVAITSVNAIISLDVDAITYEEKDGYLKITKTNDNESANKILNNLINMLTELAEDYPKNISIRNEDK